MEERPCQGCYLQPNNSHNNKASLDRLTLVLQATPFTERGRVWSRCNYRVVVEERNYRPLRFGNKMLTSAKHIVTQLCSMTMDAIYEERGSDWSRQVSVVATTRWLQRDQTLPLSAKGVACETKTNINLIW